MGFDFILTIMLFGIGLIDVVEENDVRLFRVKIENRQYEVICYNNEVRDIRDGQGEYIDVYSDDDEDGEKPYSDEWMEIENIVNQFLN